ncbi:MAG: hypothetical protein HKM04_02230 [Legionellales bacterium]|nr:hypothetical protein [Legionellales bacterium]
MTNVIYHETITAEWRALVCEAEKASSIILPDELEGYLVLMLTRFTEQTHLADTVLALEYLEAQTMTGFAKGETLRDVADKCLLIAGLFPQRADKKRVRISYFVEVGRSAYDALAQSKRASLSQLFADLSQNFVLLMDVLLNCRQLPPQLLTPMQALELWSDTQSKFALKILSMHKNDNYKILFPSSTKLM